MYNGTEPSSKYARNEITKKYFPNENPCTQTIPLYRLLVLFCSIHIYILFIHLRETVVCSDSILPVTVCKYNYIEMTKIAWNSFGKRGK